MDASRHLRDHAIHSPFLSLSGRTGASRRKNTYRSTEVHQSLQHLRNGTELPVPGAQGTNGEQKGGDEQKGLARGGAREEAWAGSEHVMIHVEDFEFPHYL